MPRRVVVDNLNIIGRSWNEIKKINWHEINRLCLQNFHIGLAGGSEDIVKMKAWLSCPPGNQKGRPSVLGKPADLKEMDKHLSIVCFDNNECDEKLIKSTLFCIAPPEYADRIRRHKTEVFVFDPFMTDELTTQILSNHNEVRFALSYNFPVFRPAHAQIEIQDTAFQNAAWVVFSGLTRAASGPIHTVTAPLESISDFVFLSLNEFKLMFEMVGLSGWRVKPLKRVAEFAFVAGLAKVAETVGTNVVSRFPAKAALLIKAAVAYAFTRAIGEALYYYITTQRCLSRPIIQQKVAAHYREGRKVAAEIMAART